MPNVNNLFMKPGKYFGFPTHRLLMDTLQINPHISERVFKSPGNWTITEAAQLKILELAKKINLPNDLSPDVRERWMKDIMYLNACLAVDCHIHHAIEGSAAIETIPCEWVIVIHEANMATLFNLITKQGIIAVENDYHDLITRAANIRMGSVGSDGFEHKMIYVPTEEYLTQ